MRVRDLGWNDFEAWARLYYSRFDEIGTNPELGVYLVDQKPTLGQEASVFANVYRAILEGSAVVSVAEEDGDVVAVCSLHRKGNHVEDRHVASLGVFVLAGYRGRGIGEALIRHALDKCAGRFELVTLTVLASNRRAVELYRRLGFEASGSVPRVFKRGPRYYDELVMWRSIP